ncbi:hypothetical protein [Roseateles saccharophilus]|uniref:Polar amino acid transport system substrate-binding protein n=1 Tax=Roseateles saccharophilus TaxID=304 RepID=A0A4R3V7W8_ROSSA|nr:hypothetical protein [Roseateles saccharophilus]MDG0831792.1 hypothetical protein [Roseateles saccharophilus]TCV01186.1 hypothetical protein EV671_1006112 [Roseateles saccharophilus]
MRRLLFPALTCALLAPGAWALDCPQPLRIGFGDRATPPVLLGQGPTFAEPPGWSVAAVREALHRIGCSAELLRLPRRRLNAALANGEVQFALLYGPSPQRLRAFSFPLDAQGRPDTAWAPVFGHMALYGRAGTVPDAAWNGVDLPPGLRVGVLAGSVQEVLAGQRGWAVEPILNPDGEVAMLLAQRFDLLLTVREGLTPEQRALLVEWAPLAAWQPYFAPAAQAFMQRHGRWTRAFWAEFCHAVRRLEPDARPVDCGQSLPSPPPQVRLER